MGDAVLNRKSAKFRTKKRTQTNEFHGEYVKLKIKGPAQQMVTT